MLPKIGVQFANQSQWPEGEVEGASFLWWAWGAGASDANEILSNGWF